MSLRAKLETFASDSREASQIAEEIFDAVIMTLRRDRRFARIPRLEVELMLADAHADTERRLYGELTGSVHPDHVGLIDGVDA